MGFEQKGGNPPEELTTGITGAKPGTTMIDGIYKGAASLSALERWQEAISQNLSASGVAGFKKTEFAFSGISAGATRLDPNSAVSAAEKGVMPQTAASISFQPGEMRETGKNTDFAVNGSGFFQVRQPNGSTAYTRNGEFLINADNTLVTKQGYEVLGEGGPIVVDPEGGPLSITAEGILVQGDTQLGKLPVVEFEDLGRLQRMSDGLFSADGATPKVIEQPAIAQGFVEGSNVSPLSEMVNLIAVSRAYEASQKVIASHDNTMREAIQTLGNPNS